LPPLPCPLLPPLLVQQGDFTVKAIQDAFVHPSSGLHPQKSFCMISKLPMQIWAAPSYDLTGPHPVCNVDAALAHLG
jgi:hypothetical protein